MNNLKKIILFIVEGLHDKDSLSLILSNLLKPDLIEFCIIGGDITSEYQSKPYNIERKLKKSIDLFFKNNKALKKSDLKQIIHLVDIDGAYINKNQIIYNKDALKTRYNCQTLETNKIEKVIDRNIRKQAILNYLPTTTKLWNIPYSIYYFSCHLEHVLHQLLNVEKKEKEKLAINFVQSFINNETDFINFLNLLIIHDDYKESWQDIKKENYSLKRLTNLSIGLKKLLNHKGEEFFDGN